MGLMIATARLFLVADKSRVVAEGDEDAAFLYCAPGDEIPEQAAELFGLVDGDLPKKAAAKAVPLVKQDADAAKGGKAPGNKGGKAPANKGGKPRATVADKAPAQDAAAAASGDAASGTGTVGDGGGASNSGDTGGDA